MKLFTTGGIGSVNSEWKSCVILRKKRNKNWVSPNRPIDYAISSPPSPSIIRIRYLGSPSPIVTTGVFSLQLTCHHESNKTVYTNAQLTVYDLPLLCVPIDKSPSPWNLATWGTCLSSRFCRFSDLLWRGFVVWRKCTMC